MSGAEWGITADEARAIMAEADGAVLVRGGWGRGPLVHPGRLIEITSRSAQIHAKGKGGVWYDLDSVKPAAGKSRNLVDALRAKRARAKEQAIEQIDRIMNQQETPMPQENPMPPITPPVPFPRQSPFWLPPRQTRRSTRVPSRSPRLESSGRSRRWRRAARTLQRRTGILPRRETWSNPLRPRSTRQRPRPRSSRTTSTPW